jgi:hypothetical protein
MALVLTRLWKSGYFSKFFRSFFVHLWHLVTANMLRAVMKASLAQDYVCLKKFIIIGTAAHMESVGTSLQSPALL